jgi:site-specific DNA-methyltransferase (adenine-specific)/modification methylase
MAKVEFKNEDCFETMERMRENGEKVSIILTSPPYATSRSNVRTKKALETYNSRYDICLDNMDEDQYVDWTIGLFRLFDEVLEENGVILYNISYGSENPNAMWRIPGAIIENTDFMIADCIVWKKKCALPNNVSRNKLTRITEFVYVICRKSEFKTFNANKNITKVGKNGQKYYENVFNFVEAPNNDGPCELNKATYSSDLCLFLLNIYAKENSVVYDPFMGTGTTAIACYKFCQSESMVCIGSELSEKQVEYSRNRLRKLIKAISKPLEIPFEYN